MLLEKQLVTIIWFSASGGTVWKKLHLVLYVQCTVVIYLFIYIYIYIYRVSQEE